MQRYTLQPIETLIYINLGNCNCAKAKALLRLLAHYRQQTLGLAQNAGPHHHLIDFSEETGCETAVLVSLDGQSGERLQYLRP